jgi:protein Tex
MDQKYIQKISEKLGLTLKQVINVDSLHSEGATIPFMARYRKEATNNLDEVAIGNIVEELKYFTELDKRKETVIKTIEDTGKMTPELKTRIEECFSSTELEDIYLPYKPKRKTRATQAIEKGLEPLAKLVFEQNDLNIDEEAAKYLNEQVKENKDALQGARDIIAEWISENEQARNKVRQLFTETASLSSKILPSKKEDPEAQKYRDYFEFNEPLSQCPSHRILAIRRGEKEGFLAMDLNIDKQTAVDELERLFVKKANPSASEVKKAIEDSFNRLLK